MGLQEISLCTPRCKACKHHTTVTGIIHGEGNLACAYIIDTNESRGCPAGDECTKFEKGKTVRRFKPRRKKENTNG